MYVTPITGVAKRGMVVPFAAASIKYSPDDWREIGDRHVAGDRGWRSTDSSCRDSCRIAWYRDLSRNRTIRYFPLYRVDQIKRGQWLSFVVVKHVLENVIIFSKRNNSSFYALGEA